MTADDALVVLAVVGFVSATLVLIGEIAGWVSGWKVRRRLRRLCAQPRMGNR